MTDEEFTAKATKILHHVLGQDEAVRNVAAGRLAALVAAYGKPITSFTLMPSDKPDNRSPQERKAFSAFEMYFKHYEGWAPEERDEYLFTAFAGMSAVLNNKEMRDMAPKFEKFRHNLNSDSGDLFEIDEPDLPEAAPELPSRTVWGKNTRWWRFNGEDAVFTLLLGPIMVAIELWYISIPLFLLGLRWGWNPISDFFINAFRSIVNSRPN